MFKLNYRIVDEIDELKSMDSKFFDTKYQHISGFFEICFGEQREGCYYHENPLREGEVGSEFLDYWFDYLLDVKNLLLVTKYTAFRELDTVNRWMEFKLYDNNVVINTAVDEKEVNNNLFISERFSGFSYVEPINFSMDFAEFKNEVISKVSRFITELEVLNPKLLKTKMVSSLLDKINDLS